MQHIAILGLFHHPCIMQHIVTEWSNDHLILNHAKEPFFIRATFRLFLLIVKTSIQPSRHSRNVYPDSARLEPPFVVFVFFHPASRDKQIPLPRKYFFTYIYCISQVKISVVPHFASTFTLIPYPAKSILYPRKKVLHFCLG